MNREMTKREIIKKLKMLNVPYKSGMTKNQLVTLLFCVQNLNRKEEAIEKKTKLVIFGGTNKEKEYSISSLEQALNQQTLSVETVINILQYVDVVDFGY